MVPSTPNPERLSETTLCLWPKPLQVTPVQLHGEEFWSFQEDKKLEGSGLFNLDLNEINASLSVMRFL